MVVTLYSGRRQPDVAEVAASLASAFARALGAGRVALVSLNHAPTTAPPGVDVRRLGADDVDAMVDLVPRLRRDHATTLLAVGDRRTDRAFFAFELGERVLLVSDLSVVGLREVQRVLRLGGALGYPAGRLCVVLREDGDATPVTPVEAATALKREIYWLLPSRRSAREADSYDGLVRRLLSEGRAPAAGAPGATPLP